jgi:hypothetical protein
MDGLQCQHLNVKMDDWEYPHFRKPPYVSIFHFLAAPITDIDEAETHESAR